MLETLVVLLAAAVLFQGIDELGDQIKLAEVQNGIEILAEKPIQARVVLLVNWVTVNAGRNSARRFSISAV